MRARVIIGIVIGVVVLCWLAVPSFIRNHRRDPRHVCINNLRLLDSAKEALAFENKRPLGTVIEAQQIKPYLYRGSDASFPRCPAGGIYTLHPTGHHPECSIKDHVVTW